MSYFYLKTSLSVNIDGAYLFMIATVLLTEYISSKFSITHLIVDRFGYSDFHKMNEVRVKLTDKTNYVHKIII